MFGRPGDGRMLFLQMFDQSAPVRLTMSPWGAGQDDENHSYNPAWDFQYIVENAQAGQECVLRSRVVYKPFVNRDEVDRLDVQWARR